MLDGNFSMRSNKTPHQTLLYVRYYKYQCHSWHNPSRVWKMLWLTFSNLETTHREILGNVCIIGPTPIVSNSKNVRLDFKSRFY